MARERVAHQSRREPTAMSEDRAPRSRSDESREDDGLELSLQEREQMLRDESMQNQLPSPPKRAGWTWFWASLNNPWNSVQWYGRMGYQPVKFEELEGWAHANMRAKDGEWSGCITVNEMLLMKVRDGDRQRFLHINHHEKPMEMQMDVADSFKRVQEEVATAGGSPRLVQDAARPGEISGLPGLERRAKRPNKFE